MIIRAHYDTDLFEGDSDAHLYDVRASLRAFSDRLLAALEARFPEADVRVTYDTRTGGGSSLCVCDDNGDELLYDDHVRAVVDEVFSGEWRVFSSSYTLSDDEATDYDSGDDRVGGALLARLDSRFRGHGVEVVHPDGFVVAVYPLDSETR